MASLLSCAGGKIAVADPLRQPLRQRHRRHRHVIARAAASPEDRCAAASADADEGTAIPIGDEPPASPPLNPLSPAASSVKPSWGRHLKFAMAGVAMTGASLFMPRPVAAAIPDFVRDGAVSSVSAATAAVPMRTAPSPGGAQTAGVAPGTPGRPSLDDLTVAPPSSLNRTAYRFTDTAAIPAAAGG
mmetsp:Transcript_19031/g.47445  ORF Transcript_19031/g.47445 Transcript_19031/m.47445 type:complete len:187 (-) Transcript_19031:12-572(-)